MITVINTSNFNISWTIYKGASNVKEDFENAILKCFIVSNNNRYPVDYQICNDGSLELQLNSGMPLGAYAIEAVWLTNANRFTKGTTTSANINRARVDEVFTISDKNSEVTNPGANLSIKVCSQVATYGKDGLSAYEMEVLRGVSRSQTAWLDDMTPKGGPTSNRPQLSSADVGVMYYDTTKQMPIWWTGTRWIAINATTTPST